MPVVRVMKHGDQLECDSLERGLTKDGNFKDKELFGKLLWKVSQDITHTMNRKKMERRVFSDKESKT